MKLHCGEFGLRCFSLFSKQTIFPRKRHSWRAKKALLASFYLHGHHKLIINDDCDDDDDNDDTHIADVMLRMIIFMMMI